MRSDAGDARSAKAFVSNEPGNLRQPVQVGFCRGLNLDRGGYFDRTFRPTLDLDRSIWRADYRQSASDAEVELVRFVCSTFY